MSTAIDTQQRQFGALPFDHMPHYASTSPSFTNPWASSSGPALAQNLYAPSHSMNHHQNLGLDLKSSPNSRMNNVSMSSYGVPTSSGSSLLAGQYEQDDILTMSQALMSPSRVQNTSTYGSGLSSYSGAASSSHPAYTSTLPYQSIGYAPAPVRSTYAMPDPSRRISQPGLDDESVRGFGDAIAASRGMIAMSQDTTPRNIYGPDSRTGRGSGDSYGFPATHSTSSSISSNGTYPEYFGGSVDSSVSEYSMSNAGSDIEGSVSSRTLPMPSAMGGMPPAPSSMMGQFSSKVSSSTQKKHKCKVCEKRFTRPSSLQTHIYSHTGEKPFQCDVEGCGRQFSVVSNLRRHHKVHKNETPSEADSEDHHSDV